MNNIISRVVKAIINKPITHQIRVYETFIDRRGHLVNEMEWINRFCQHLKVKNIEDTTDENVSTFLDMVSDEYKTDYAVLCARKAVNKIRAFYRARTYRGKRNPIQWEMVEKVKELREKDGLPYRTIAEMLGRDVRQIHRWYSYAKKPFVE